MRNDSRDMNSMLTYGLLMSAGALIWISVASLYHAYGIQWLEHTDADWYWEVVKNPAAFDISIQPLYPYIVRGMIELFPNIDEAALGQFFSFVCYTASIPFMYQIFQALHQRRAVELTLLWALFPLTGVTMSVYPRANAFLLLMTVLCFWGYVRNNKYVFLVSAALLPLIHKSSQFLLIFLIPLAIYERKIKWWMALLAGIPTFIYIYSGSFVHGSLLWYFQYYYGDRITPVTSLPVADGLVGTVILGARGSVPDLIQGGIVIAYLALNIYMLSRKVWRANLIALSTLLPVLLLGLLLPASEILAIITYTSFAVISFSLLDLKDGTVAEQKRVSWIFILLIAGFYISQFMFAFYEFRYYGIL